MSIQQPKILVDTGDEGVEGTGDTLYQGGTSINRNLNSLYNAFGDYRIFRADANQGNQQMTIHSAGYYQKHTRSYYSGQENPSGNPVDFGSMHDLSVTRDGAGDLIITLPAGNGHAGEYIDFINIDGSIGLGAGKEVTIRTSGSGDSIGLAGTQMKLQKSYFHLRLWVDKSSPTGSHWAFKMDSVIGDNSIPYQTTISNIAAGTSKEVVLFNKSQYNLTKHLIHVTERGTNIRQEASEVLLMVNNSGPDTNVYSTEYARIRTTPTANSKSDLLYESEYIISGTQVKMVVKNIGTLAIDVHVKAIEAMGGLS